MTPASVLALAMVSATPGSPFQECHAQVVARPDSWEAYRCFRLVARRENRADEAARQLERLLRADVANPWPRLALAGVRADQNRDEAEQHYRAAAQALSARGDATGEALARTLLAIFLQGRGRMAAAEPELARAESLAATVVDSVLRARVAVAQALVAYRKGDYGRGRRLLEEVEKTVFADGPVELQSEWLSAMGTLSWATGRLEKADESYRRQAELLRAAGDRYEEARALGNVAFMAGVMSRSRDEQRALALQTLAAAHAGGNATAEGRAHWTLGGLSSGPERIAHRRRSLALSRASGKGPEISLALRSLAHNLVDENPPEAYALIEQAIALSRTLGDLAEVARNRITRGQLRWKTGPREKAIADSLAALDAIEATRNLQSEDLVRARRFAQWGNPYNWLVGHLLSGHLLPPGGAPSDEDVALAFTVFERKRARTLLDELDAARATPALAPAGPLAEQRKEVLRGITDVQLRLVGATTEGGRAAGLAELDRLEREEEALRAELARQDPVFAALRQPQLASLADVQAVLRDDEALLAFQIAWRVSPADPEAFAGAPWLFVLTHGETRVVSLSDDWFKAYPLFLGLFERRDGSEAPAAKRLFREMLADALARLPSGVGHLVIVPDGRLHHFPFDALRPPGAAALAERYEVSIAPSATLWLRWRQAGAAPAPSVLALADPELPSARADAAPERAWALGMAARMGRLPHARREARFVVDRVAAGSVLRAGPDASEHALKQTDLGRFGVLHLAAHALVDDDHPERSAILLSPGAPEEDGLLQIREIVGLDLRGKLVVLSACRSASGEVLAGEGVLGLARAFFQAGARAVVGSLWPLRDDEAERLVRSLYGHLAEGHSVAAALAAARRDRIRAGDPAAAWAGLVVLGDGSLVPFPGGRPQSRLTVWVPLVALVALGAAVLVGVRRVSSRRLARSG